MPRVMPHGARRPPARSVECALTCGFLLWGGRDSNPRPRDYESHDRLIHKLIPASPGGSTSTCEPNQPLRTTPTNCISWHESWHAGSLGGGGVGWLNPEPLTTSSSRQAAKDDDSR